MPDSPFFDLPRDESVLALVDGPQWVERQLLGCKRQRDGWQANVEVSPGASFGRYSYVDHDRIRQIPDAG